MYRDLLFLELDDVGLRQTDLGQDVCKLVPFQSTARLNGITISVRLVVVVIMLLNLGNDRGISDAKIGRKGIILATHHISQVSL